MTRKGMILSLILAILVLAIVLVLYEQNVKRFETIKNPEQGSGQEYNSELDFVVESESGIELSKLKSYQMPILIQLRFR